MEKDKGIEIFREFIGENADRLKGNFYPADVNSIITSALMEDHPEWDDDTIVEKDGIGFHMVDWQRDAAFIVALVLFPDRFTSKEICEGLDRFLCHVPQHVLNAAKLAGYDIQRFIDDTDTEQHL